MSQTGVPDFTVFGAGLSGALMSVYLARAGKSVTLFERRSDPRAGSVERGRSINLALSTRGITALRGVGLHTKVLEHAIAMHGRLIHEPDGTSVFQPYSHHADQAIHSISRSGLNSILLDAAEDEPHVRIEFTSRCAGVEFSSRRATVLEENGRSTREVSCGAIIGADGAFSAIRGEMLVRDRFSYSQQYLPHGYKEFTIQPTQSGDFAMRSDVLHIWPRGEFMLIALPNEDKSFTATLFWPNDGALGPEGINTPERAERFFERHFPDALVRMTAFREEFEHHPHSSLCTIRCDPWHVGGDALLIGDAAHAIVPFYGQGMNSAFEDCRILADTLRSFEHDTTQAFPAFTTLRCRHTNTLADLALANYKEMRDRVQSPVFRARKWIERALARVLPSAWYTPLYEMVSFSNIPYADAVQRSRRQHAAVLAGAALLMMIILIVVF